MNRKSPSTLLVLRYVYAMLAIIVVTVGVAIIALYVGQQGEIEARDRIQFFHLESTSELAEVAREARLLRRVTLGEVDTDLPDHYGAAGVQHVMVGYSGILYSMRSRLAHLSTLSEQQGDPVFAAAANRLDERLDAFERTLLDSESPANVATSVDVLISTIEQNNRLHRIAADVQLHKLADRQNQRPLHIRVLAACLGFAVLAVGYLVISVRRSLIEQKKIELALAESQERLHHIQKLDALGRLVGGIAHDFNNSLTAILGHAELLQDKVAGDERLETGLNEIQKAGLQAAALTQQLLAFSRRQKFKPRVLDLNTVFQRMETMLRRIVGADVQLKASYAEDLCAIEVDPDRLQQVIMNLVSNARDAMPDGGTLTIATENVTISVDESEDAGVPAGDYARLSVSDEGIGMDDLTMQRVFEPFFTTKEEGRGTGLGLSTVHGIVTASGGHIVVTSEKGTGARFDLYFQPAEGEPATDEPSTDPQENSETVLVVEDDQQVRRFIESGLSSLGYRVLTAPSGTAGLHICRTEPGPIDVIVSDVVMPEISGPRFMAGALKLRPDIVAIYISAYTKDVIFGMRRGNDEADIPLITKPFDLSTLANLVREQLDKSVDTTLSAGPT